MKPKVHASKRILFILTLLLLAGVQPALAQFVVRALNTPNGIGVLTGSDFTASVAVGQAVAGTSSNADFTAALGLGVLTGAVMPTGVEVAPAGDEVPGEYRLDQNYPNPFNPQTTIAFDLKKPGHVSLAVYNALGHLFLPDPGGQLSRRAQDGVDQIRSNGRTYEGCLCSSRGTLSFFHLPITQFDFFSPGQVIFPIDFRL